jgi:sulfopyruvate decarboxylase subunit alpha
MFAGPDVVAALTAAGATHVVWIPDSDLGTWEPAFALPGAPKLIRVCREGEAFAVAAGLWLGGQRPVVVMQCTGLFEAGDSLRNFLHDLKLPLFFIVGIRSAKAFRAGTTADTCPVFAEPILRAWSVPFDVFDDTHSVEELVAAYRRCIDERRARAVLIAE